MGDLKPGTKVTFADGYNFYVTLHGPLVEMTCVLCGKPCLHVGKTDRYNQWGLKEDESTVPPLCGECLRVWSRQQCAATP